MEFCGQMAMLISVHLVGGGLCPPIEALSKCQQGPSDPQIFAIGPFTEKADQELV